MSQLFTIDEIEQRLRDEVVKAGGAAKWCRKHKIEMKHSLHMFSNGTAASLPRVAEVMGLQKVERWKRRTDT